MAKKFDSIRRRGNMISGEDWQKISRRDQKKIIKSVNSYFYPDQKGIDFPTLLLVYVLTSIVFVPSTKFGVILPIAFGCAVAYITWVIITYIWPSNFRKRNNHKPKSINELELDDNIRVFQTICQSSKPIELSNSN